MPDFTDVKCHLTSVKFCLQYDTASQAAIALVLLKQDSCVLIFTSMTDTHSKGSQGCLSSASPQFYRLSVGYRYRFLCHIGLFVVVFKVFFFTFL